jgi:hypothetical protein
MGESGRGPGRICRAADRRCAKGRWHPFADQTRSRLRCPDFLSAGPRDVLVLASLVEEARQVLEDTTGAWVLRAVALLQLVGLHLSDACGVLPRVEDQRV